LFEFERCRGHRHVGGDPLRPPGLRPAKMIAVTATTSAASPLRVWSALWIVYVVWGSTYLALAVTIQSLPPLIALGLRFLVAAALLAGWLAFRGGVARLRVTRAELAGAALVGLLLLTVGNGTVTLAERFVPSGVAALIAACVTVWVVLIRVVTGDHPPLVTWLGVVIGLGGVATLVLPGAHVATVGGASAAERTLWSLAIVVGTLSWALGSWLQPRMPTPRDPLVLTTYEMLVGGFALTVLGGLRGEHLGQMLEGTWASYVGWLYLVTMGSLVAYTAFVWLLGHAPLSLVTTYAYVNPVVAVLLGFLVLGEPLTAGVLLGGAIVVTGVGLVVSGERLARART
jgi:drug/metabolite transporter (DMT)-like permease